MAAVDSFHLLYREISRSCSCYVESLALVGALYTAGKALVLLTDCYSLLRVHFLPRLMYRQDLSKRFGNWAVILGAPGRLAVAYAEELASQGVNIILIGTDNRALEALVTAMGDTHCVQILVLEADFAQGHTVCHAIGEVLKDKDIGFLVNSIDASLNRPQQLAKHPEERVWEALNRNVLASTLMAQMVLPGMVQRGQGAVVNISSGVCLKPTTNKAVFAATTAYLDHLSRSMYYEYSHKGVFVQSLLPLGVSEDDSTTRGWLVPHPRVYAKHAVSTLGISHRTTGYWPHSLQLLFLQSMPEWMWVWGSRTFSRTS